MGEFDIKTIWSAKGPLFKTKPNLGNVLLY